MSGICGRSRGRRVGQRGRRDLVEVIAMFRSLAHGVGFGEARASVCIAPCNFIEPETVAGAEMRVAHARRSSRPLDVWTRQIRTARLRLTGTAPSVIA